jgi:hypothetical protein
VTMRTMSISIMVTSATMAVRTTTTAMS